MAFNNQPWRQSLLCTVLLSFSICLAASEAQTIKEIDLSASYTTFDSDCGKKSEYCTGSRKYKDGAIYKGEFRFGKAHGWGEMTWLDGSNYEGEFENDFRHGKGVQRLPNGASYEGEWKLGFMEGKGTYTFGCGHRYIGDFIEDKMEGQGSILMTNGESYEGNWKNNVPEGKGKFTRIDKGEYIGNNKKGKRHGSGIISYQNQVDFFGNWNNGEINGEATFEFANGTKIISYWKNGIALPQLKFVDTDKTMISTNWNTIHSKAFKYKEEIALAWYLAAAESISTKKIPTAKEQLKRAKIFAQPKSPLQKSIVLQRKAIQQRNSNQECF